MSYINAVRKRLVGRAIRDVRNVKEGDVIKLWILLDDNTVLVPMSVGPEQDNATPGSLWHYNNEPFNGRPYGLQGAFDGPFTTEIDLKVGGIVIAYAATNDGTPIPGTGVIRSALRPNPPEAETWQDIEGYERGGAMTAIEKMVLNHWMSGIDVTEPSYTAGLKDTIDTFEKRFKGAK